MNPLLRSILQVALPLIVAAIGVTAALALANSRETTPPVDAPKTVPTVEVAVARPSQWRARVTTHGTVQPATRSDLVAEVGGRVLEVSPSLAEGGFFSKDEVLVRLDPRDYELAVVEARAVVAQANLALQLEQAESDSARREWEAMQRNDPPTPLVLREPQLAEARARLDAANARLESAERDVERCVLRAPYEGRVLTKSVDLGQYVVRNARLAEIYSIDAAEVRLPLPDSELAFLELEVRRAPSGAFADASGPEVVLSADFGGRKSTWNGRIVRTEGQLDARSRMVNMIARVEDPYAVDGDASPLLVNLFVDAELLGPPREDVFVLPRAALRGSDAVLVVDAEERIHRRTVVVLRKERDSVVIDQGLAIGERICITPLDAVVEGMQVRVEAGRREDEPGRSQGTEAGR